MKRIITAGLCLIIMVMLTFTVSAQTEYAAKVGQTSYATVAEAVVAANGETVTLLTDSAENLTVSGDLYLDLNGHTLAGLSITDGTLYGMDTTTDDYDCSDGYGSITAIAGDYAAYHQVDVNGNPQRYLAVAGESGVSFHRIYLGITHRSLQPAKQGVGYKALFAADSVAAAQMESYGYSLWLDGYNKITRLKDGASFVSGNTVSLHVVNYDAENYGQTTLYATVQMKLKDGTVILADEQGMTLKDTFEFVNANVAAYTKTQLDALGAWIMPSDTMLGWEVTNILQSDLSYDMNAGRDLILYTELTGTLQSVSVKDTEMTLENATLENGVLTVPAVSFLQDTMPSGKLILEVITDSKTAYFVGDFTWIIHNWNDLAYMEKHLKADGNVYTGSLALGADIDLTGKNINNFVMFKMANEFNGTFDGRNHTITGIKPSATTGLLGTVGADGVVENLKLTGVQITTYGGGVTYACKGILQNIYVQGSITGDGMGTSSNLSNFGCGLLAGIYESGAKVNNCIVEMTSIAADLRLATAFGRLRNGVSESIFTGCYAIGASGNTFMQNVDGIYVKADFTTDTNVNFAVYTDLWKHAAAREVALRLGMDKPTDTIELSYSYDMSASNEDLVITGLDAADFTTTAYVKGTDIVLKDVTVTGGTLRIPAASFVQKLMPSGDLTLVVQLAEQDIEISGNFVWIIDSWANGITGLAYMHNHLTNSGNNYYGDLALGADVALGTGNPANFTMGQTPAVFQGILDGRGHTVSGFAVKSPARSLFYQIGESGIVKNLNMIGVTVSTYAAPIAYICKGTLHNIFVQGSITADGMGASSNLSNFGCGLLAGQYYASAKVDGCMVELSAITDGLRLATAFGKLRGGVTESIFTNCDAIGANGCTYMCYTNKTWTKADFTASTNRNYTDRKNLMSSADGALRYIALQPVVDFVEQDNHDYTVSGTVHNYQITDTDHFIDSTYSIVISKTADEDTLTAANDFAALFRTATGLRIGRVYAENVTYTASSQYIVIGDNTISRAAGVYGDDLGTQGFRILTVGNSIFVVGADSQGVQFGVYELLHQLFGYECFGTGGYTIDKNVTQIPLKNYDITDVPDIGIRRSNYHYLTMDSVTERRMRLTYFGDYIIPVGEKMVHNSSQYISKEDYPDKTDWFSTDGANLCYTAHGNETEKAQMQAIIADIIIEHLEANPDKNAIGMMQEDNNTLCDCESCTAMQEHYSGAQVASVIIFLNRVCELVDEHFGGERDFTVLFFAYHATSQPPVTYDEVTGTYAPIDEQVILNSHLKPFFADTDGDYTKDFYNADTANAEAAEQMNGWAALSEDMHFWMYGTNFSFYLIPYNTFDAMQANYKYAIEHGASFIYDQGQASQSGTATGWSNLKIYLYSKLTWNVNQDREELIDRFMEGYYGPAADTVKDVFYSWKFVANFQTNELGFIGSRTIYKSLLKKDYWNQAVLLDWTARLEQAMQEVSHLQSTDPDSYAKYMKNIAAERIAYNFLLLELFQDSMTQEQIQAAKDQFYHDYQLTNIGYQQDREEPVSDLLIKWGIIEATS